MARTVEFDRNTVLENAMDAFWQKGYSMTSISNLVDATKLNPGSIYAAFKSKEGLFLETLEFYGQRSLEKLRRHIEASASPLAGIESFLSKLVKTGQDDRGCLIVNTILEMSSHNPRIQALANKRLKAIEDQLLSVLQQAQTLGELPVKANPKALAKYLMVSIWGLRVMAKTNPDHDEADIVLAQILASLKAG
jgi:TetR/AcrR family transcriptional repressor of nem operon